MKILKDILYNLFLSNKYESRKFTICIEYPI